MQADLNVALEEILPQRSHLARVSNGMRNYISSLLSLSCRCFAGLSLYHMSLCLLETVYLKYPLYHNETFHRYVTGETNCHTAAELHNACSFFNNPASFKIMQEYSAPAGKIGWENGDLLCCNLLTFPLPFEANIPGEIFWKGVGEFLPKSYDLEPTLFCAYQSWHDCMKRSKQI